MQKLIVEFKKLTPENRKAFSELYTDGYGDNEVVSFTSSSGAKVQCLPLQVGDISYLVKIGSVSRDFWENDQSLEGVIEIEDDD
jgi:hypothetical protein